MALDINLLNDLKIELESVARSFNFYAQRYGDMVGGTYDPRVYSLDALAARSEKDFTSHATNLSDIFNRLDITYQQPSEQSLDLTQLKSGQKLIFVDKSGEEIPFATVTGVSGTTVLLRDNVTGLYVGDMRWDANKQGWDLSTQGKVLFMPAQNTKFV